MTEPGVLDDDYWKNLDGRLGEERRKRFYAAMDRLDALSNQLTEEADREQAHEQGTADPETTGSEGPESQGSPSS